MAIIRARIESPVKELLKRSSVQISKEKDETVLVAQHLDRQGQPITHWPGPCWQEGDRLIYGYPHLESIRGISGALLLLTGLALAFFTLPNGPSASQTITIFICIGSGALLLYWSTCARGSRFITFDRKNKLVHIPTALSQKQDSLSWKDISIMIYDENHMYRPFSYSHSRLAIVRPPLDPQSGEIPGPYQRHKIINLDGLLPAGFNSGEAEAIYRYILEFMRPTTGNDFAGEVARNDRKICAENFNGDWDLMRRHLGWFWYRLDPDKLPDKPNWIRHPDGRWERTGPGVKALRPWWDNLIRPRRIPSDHGTENSDA